MNNIWLSPEQVLNILSFESGGNLLAPGLVGSPIYTEARSAAETGYLGMSYSESRSDIGYVQPNHLCGDTFCFDFSPEYTNSDRDIHNVCVSPEQAVGTEIDQSHCSNFTVEQTPLAMLLPESMETESSYRNVYDAQMSHEPTDSTAIDQSLEHIRIKQEAPSPIPEDENIEIDSLWRPYIDSRPDIDYLDLNERTGFCLCGDVNCRFLESLKYMKFASPWTHIDEAGSLQMPITHEKEFRVMEYSPDEDSGMFSQRVEFQNGLEELSDLQQKPRSGRCIHVCDRYAVPHCKYWCVPPSDDEN